MSPLKTTWSRTLGAADSALFDAFVDEAGGGHYAQTRPWGDVVRAGRSCSLRYFIARDGDRVVGAAQIVQPAFAAIPLPVAIIERGPVTRSTDDLPRVLSALRKEARFHGVARLSAMPYWSGESARSADEALAEAGWKDVQEVNGAHALTLRIDVAGRSDEELTAGHERAQVRRRMRQAEKAGASVTERDPGAIPAFERFFGELMGDQGKRGKPPGWYRALERFVEREPRRATTFAVKHEGEIVAVVMILRHGSVATYSFGASTSRSVGFAKMAPAVVAGMRWARDQGCATFDMGGVPMDGDNDAKRVAIAEFKYDFSKEKVPLTREHARIL